MSTEFALDLDTSLAALPPPERERLALYGAQLLCTEMESRLALAARTLVRFEQAYKMTLAQLNEAGLPQEANLEAHEDYVEWSGWQATYDESKQILKTLRAILETADALTPAS